MKNESISNETDSTYPGDFVSTKIDSLGKYAIDTSDEFADSMTQVEPGVIDSQEKLDKLIALDAAEVIIENSKVMIDRRKVEARKMIDEYNDPEKYRSLLDRSIRSDNIIQQICAINRLDRIFNYWGQSPYIDHILGFSEQDKGKKKYIIALLSKDENDNYKVSTEQFRNFLQWHNFEHRKAEKKLSEQVPEYKQSFIAMLTDGVAKGILPENATNNIKALEEMQDIRLDDGLDSVVDGSMGNFHESGVVNLSPDHLSQDGTPNTVYHEFLHAIEGRCHPEDEIYGHIFDDIDNNIYRYWAESEIIPDDSDYESLTDAEREKLQYYYNAVRVLKESACENMIIKLLNNLNISHSYKPESYFIINLIKGSNGILSGKDFESAFFENDMKKFSAFIDKIRSCYPDVEDIILEIGKIKNWTGDTKVERMINVILDEEYERPAYDTTKPESRFLTGKTYIDYLRTLKK